MIKKKTLRKPIPPSRALVLKEHSAPAMKKHLIFMAKYKEMAKESIKRVETAMKDKEMAELIEGIIEEKESMETREWKTKEIEEEFESMFKNTEFKKELFRVLRKKIPDIESYEPSQFMFFVQHHIDPKKNPKFERAFKLSKEANEQLLLSKPPIATMAGIKELPKLSARLRIPKVTIGDVSIYYKEKVEKKGLT